MTGGTRATGMPSDDDLVRLARETWVSYWTGRPDARPSLLLGWDDPRLPPEQREACITVGRALFETGALAAVRAYRETLAAMP